MGENIITLTVQGGQEEAVVYMLYVERKERPGAGFFFLFLPFLVPLPASSSAVGSSSSFVETDEEGWRESNAGSQDMPVGERAAKTGPLP